MFVWAEIPDRFKPLGSLEFAKQLLQEAKVAVSPGIGFGEYGNEFVRFALVENEQRIHQAVRGIRRFLR
jgi:alanine-synthesizing transaminase